jgi:hypothetical protein
VTIGNRFDNDERIAGTSIAANALGCKHQLFKTP